MQINVLNVEKRGFQVNVNTTKRNGEMNMLNIKTKRGCQKNVNTRK